MYQIKQPDVQLQPFISEERAHTPDEINTTLQERQKWRTTLQPFVILACAVLVINVGFLAWAIHTRGATNGLGVLLESSCDATKKANVGVHLLINVLSSAVLGASNYCMQCLSAPTRPEVDQAHSKGKWLDTGIPSLRNVVSSDFGKRKKLCWWILAISSLPLHLCYNSVVFMSLSAQTYAVVQFGPEAKAAIENGTFYGVLNTTNANEFDACVNGRIYANAYNAGQLGELTPLECIDAYSTAFQATRGNVFLVVDEGLMNANEAVGTFLRIERSGTCSTETGTRWMYEHFRWEGSNCFAQDGNRFVPRLKSDPSNWTPLVDHPVKRCLSEHTGQKCKLNFSVHLAPIVNIAKALTVLAAILELRNDPMLTLGDAVASFLQNPDPSSKNMCLVTQADIRHAELRWREMEQPRAYTNERHTWASSVRKGKRVMVWISLFSAIAVLLGLFIWGHSAIQGQKDISGVLRISLQSDDPRTIIQSGTDALGSIAVFENVFVANSPQVTISIVYFSYNGAITSMLLAHEWSDYFSRSKSLRVLNHRQGLQRSTYFLQLPYRYALPLLECSALLHWLASQSLSVVSVELYNMFGDLNC